MASVIIRGPDGVDVEWFANEIAERCEVRPDMVADGVLVAAGLYDEAAEALARGIRAFGAVYDVEVVVQRPA
jgi:hypothetical protein